MPPFSIWFRFLRFCKKVILGNFHELQEKILKCLVSFFYKPIVWWTCVDHFSMFRVSNSEPRCLVVVIWGSDWKLQNLSVFGLFLLVFWEPWTLPVIGNKMKTWESMSMISLRNFLWNITKSHLFFFYWCIPVILCGTMATIVF